MSQVVIEVNERAYTMQCSPGEEEHLRELAQLLDAQVAEIKASVGQVGDVRLLLMAGLVIADQLSEALKKIEDLQEQVSGLRHSGSRALEQGRTMESRAAERLTAAAKRLEQMARETREAVQ